jgi:hypothetical protein
MSVDYMIALEWLYPSAEWSITANDYSTLVWHSEGDAPSQAELDAAWPRVQAERHNAQARAARHAAFVAEADPLFMKWQAGEGTEEEWLSKREEIRNRHPYVEVPE